MRLPWVAIALRTVTTLFERYDELLALSLTDTTRLQRIAAAQGRVILTLDGLHHDVGHEVLWGLRNCLSGAVLLQEVKQELKAVKKRVRGIRPIKRRLKGRNNHEAEVLQGYCAAVRSALADDARPPLSPRVSNSLIVLTPSPRVWNASKKGGLAPGLHTPANAAPEKSRRYRGLMA
jgi:hypothetical protein